ncbi:MAG: type I methionyl aminopeptidase [Deltaproteobacteria bacterium]|jgi:methionyl aminopeptidase|nr:type I methionyl aminopeptidase [Deltaproteobacteria bacterium]
MIFIKTASEIDKIRRSGRLASQTLDHVGANIAPGVTTRELDRLISGFMASRGAVPATLGYKRFPASSCISVNEVVCHGIPDSRIIMDGDLVKVDVTTVLDGFFGDTCRTFKVGNVPPKAAALADATYEAMMLAIAAVRDGARLGDIGFAVQSHVEPKGYSVVREFVGHGVGKEFHESPSVHHRGEKGAGVKLKSGMTFTIEPMVNEGGWKVKVLGDGWTAVTADGKLSAQFEHTLLVDGGGSEILTLSE